ncbi:AAA family ATPase [Dyadobacter sp. 32]|uniref:ATP-dependent nuclease n=1 Tax=Dyadobacter sp. 32 TaxID=538966 RepID=UPI0011EF1B50
MILTQLQISGFQSFGLKATTIKFEEMTFLLGPNGSGKTAVLQALTRLFSYDQSLRRIRQTDFNISIANHPDGENDAYALWIEATFEFPELKKANEKYATIPVHFAHMQMESSDDLPKIRFRLAANMDESGEIEESFVYVIQADRKGNPVKTVPVPKFGRNAIQVHYIPAKRDPGDHISYAANSLLGRALRAADWKNERQSVVELTSKITQAVASNIGVLGIGEKLGSSWQRLHKGTYYANPTLGFDRNEIENLLRHLTVSFTPAHGIPLVDFSRLSDGQQSLLYLSLVLALQSIGSDVLANKTEAFDVDKLRPAVFTLVAMEEPENSLSPHYLGRVIKELTSFSNKVDAQAVIATHAPSLLKRVAPEQIRYLRLDINRNTFVMSILMPEKTDEAYKFVREAVQAYPELYFSRLVILGEGDSEEIVIPKLLEVGGLQADEVSISVVPLGGRHVNHFWRLLNGLGIPQITLLDLDLSRHQGGWGRVKYAIQQLLKFPTTKSSLNASHLSGLPKWNGADLVLESKLGIDWLNWLEKAGVFFSSPLDIDFAMLQCFSEAYGLEDDELEEPDEEVIKKVLGNSHGDVHQYEDKELLYFDPYYDLFKLGSKPATHLDALSKLSPIELKEGMPEVYVRLLAQVKEKLNSLPE